MILFWVSETDSATNRESITIVPVLAIVVSMSMPVRGGVQAAVARVVRLANSL